MKEYFATVSAGFRELWSDKIGVGMLTVFPILLIIILGSALESFISGDSSIEAVPAAYVSDEADSQLYEVLTTGEVADYITLTRHGEAEARALLERGEVVAVVVEREGEIEFLQTGAQPRGSGIVLSVIEAYRQNWAAALMRYERGEDPWPYLGIEVPVTGGALGIATPSAMDYYGVTMLIMILMYSGMNGMTLFNYNMTGEMGRRLHLAPVPRATVVLGTLTASTLTSFSQGLVVYLFSRFVYGTNWGNRVWPVFLAMLLVILISQFLCILFLLLTGSEGVATGIAQVFIWTMTFLSGGMVPVDYGPAQKIFQYIPNALAQSAVFEVIYGGQSATVWRSFALLGAMVLLLGFVTLLVGRRKVQ